MEKAIIVAYDVNRAIGRGGDLPWGRKTFESIGCRPLPDRENIVISSRPTGVKGVLTAMNLPSALALSRYPVFIIGGAQVYGDALKMPEIDTIYATEVDAAFPDADTFFPELDMSVWREISRVHHPADTENKYDFDFVIYHRII